jgi:peptide alpha-N-acetyltransferase
LIIAFGVSNPLQLFLETELTNKASLSLYEKLGFARTKLLKRYYMNGNDAFRLKLYFTPPGEQQTSVAV